jgi:PAS domain S-box-containing protein
MFGDVVERSTYQSTAKNEENSAGLEVGKTAFCLRVVYPYYSKNGDFIGCVELGNDTNHFFEIMKKESGCEYSLFVLKKYLDKKDWASVREVKGLRNNWDDLKNCVNIEKTLEINFYSDIDLENLPGEGRLLGIVKIGSSYYSKSAFPIYDIDNNTIGGIFILSNADIYYSQYYRNILIAAPGFFAIFLIIGIVMYVIVIRINRKIEIAKIDAENNVKAKTAEIIERKKVEKALKESEDKLKESSKNYRLLVENQTDLIIEVDNEGRYLFVNPSFCSLFEKTKKDLIGKASMVLVHEDDRAITEEEMKKIYKPPYTAYVEQRAKTKIGWRWIAWSAKAVLDENKNVVGTIAGGRDITERKEAEEIIKNQTHNLKIAKNDAERYAKAAEAANRTKSEFLSSMSHEIRTPMNAILGFSELLDSQIDDPGQRKYLESIKSSGKILLDLINDILDLSKIEAGMIELKQRPLNPKFILNDIGKIFSVKMKEKGLKFLIDVDKELPKALQLDEVRIRQILFNLMGNAVKFTDKGYVKLSARGIYHEQKSKFDLIFSVKDTGIGISAENKGIIFDAFRQSKGQRDEKYGGTGLGLAITKKLVEAMGGKISVDSIVGKGSTFKVILKKVAVASVEGIPEDLKETRIDNIKFKKQTILVVDDIESNRILLKETLKPYNLSTIEAKNGKEGIDAAKKYHPDLILMDLRMPVMDGYEATSKIKQDSNLKDIPVIILTASAMKEQEEKIKKIKCEGYIRKPIKKADLIQELIKHLDYTDKESKEERKAPETKEGKDIPKALTKEAKKKIPELILILESYIKEKWEEVKKTSIISDIEDFAKEIEELGRRYELRILLKWGEKISSQAESFEMDKLPKTLKYFTELIDEVKKLTK